MTHHPRRITALAALAATVAAASRSPAEEPPPPRPGLTALQTQQAVRIAGGSLDAARPKGGPAPGPDADRREYVVSVERMVEKPAAGAADAPARAVVTQYRYADDTTVYSVVDLASGKAVEVKTAQHMRTPLSDGEFRAAQALARDKVEEVRALYERFGDRVEVYPQFSQYAPDGDPRVHRVVHILYRIDKRDLSAPRPVVDLTTREVRVPTPAPPPGGVAPKPRPTGK